MDASNPDPELRTDPRFALGQSIGMAAFLWGYPLVEMARTCRLQTAPATAAGSAAAWRAGIDRLHHATRAATARDRDVVTPANDLLYTTGWFHLGNGPRLLHVPASRAHGGRYFVLALYDAWTNNFANPGLRTSDPAGEVVVLVGPRGLRGWTPPPGARVIESPTDLVWLIGRVVVGDEADHAGAQALQTQIRLEAAPGTDSGALPAAVQHWVGPPQEIVAALEAAPQQAARIAAEFFANLCQCLQDAPPSKEDTGLAAWIAHARLVPSSGFDLALLDAPLRAGLQQGLLDGVALLRKQSRSRVARPWATSWAIGVYGHQHVVRALTAYKGLGALAPQEAVYAMGDFDADKQPLVGARGYLLHFAAGELPPVDAFWSITMYAADRFLHPNAIERFSIGDRTPGLRPNPDGSLTLRIGHAQPADRANWLPAPEGGFYLILRLYAPRAEARSWRIPALTPITDPSTA